MSRKKRKVSAATRCDPNCVLRTDRGDSFTFSMKPVLQTLAMELAYVVRNRKIWAEDPESSRDFRDKTLGKLEGLGLDVASLQSAARQAQVLEVSIPYCEEQQGWEVRIMPWEFLLGFLLDDRKRASPLLITRHLHRVEAPAGGPIVAPKEILWVDSAPGALAPMYSFQAEQQMVESILGEEKLAINPLPNPNLEELHQQVAASQADIIHLSAVDTHQAIQLLGWGGRYRKRDIHDGVALRGKGDAIDFVGAQELAEALTANREHPPCLVVFNTYNSAARCAALTVANGARASISFQDEFDDALAELFFAAFYQSWRLSKWNLLLAFRFALNKVMESRSPGQGAGVVLWTDHSLFGDQDSATESRATGLDAIVDLSDSYARVQAKDVKYHSTGDGKVAPLLNIEVKAKQEINYSLLHNQQDLFDDFRLTPRQAGTVRGVSVRVDLNLGADTATFDVRYDIDQPLDIKDQVHLPLASVMARSIRQSVQSLLTVSVTVDEREEYRKAFQVRLLPVDEWQDSVAQRHWLPSFVLPNDNAVHRIVQAAQKYLIALADNGNAGFDGYQALGARDADTHVDNQVQALWWALVNDLPLNYINPPPSFSTQSQRLRTPGDILASGRGTCIDLSLLLAACMEYIDLRPVLFLLRGHAFVGYCRSEASHIGMRERVFNRSPDIAVTGGERPDPADLPLTAWMSSSAAYSAILQLVRNGDLVPVESVWLTHRAGFWEAVDEGLKNLRGQSEFESLFDVYQARRSGVTPLPIVTPLNRG